MATNSSILDWEIPWTEEPGGLQSKGSQKIGHDWAANHNTEAISKQLCSHDNCYGLNCASSTKTPNITECAFFGNKVIANVID